MPKPLSLKHLLTLAISLLMCAIIALNVLSVGRAGVRRVESEIGLSLRLLADQMQDKLDRTLFERYREIGVAAQLFGTLAGADLPNGTTAWLLELQKTYPDYAWIGFVGRSGTVSRATDGILEGVDVSNRPWFIGGLKEATVGDVHADEELSSFAAAPRCHHSCVPRYFGTRRLCRRRDNWRSRRVVGLGLGGRSPRLSIWKHSRRKR